MKDNQQKSSLILQKTKICDFFIGLFIRTCNRFSLFLKRNWLYCEGMQNNISIKYNAGENALSNGFVVYVPYGFSTVQLLSVLIVLTSVCTQKETLNEKAGHGVFIPSRMLIVPLDSQPDCKVEQWEKAVYF